MKVSIIVPCYNQGKYIRETLKAIEKSTYPYIETIIVNDGSTDVFTLEVFEQLKQENFKVLDKINGGLASARNFGIQHASGDLILPLDSDDLISPTYIEEAVVYFMEDPNLGLVYSKAKLFGYQNKEWNLPPFSVQRFLQGNIIFCSAFFKKADWEVVGGYKIEMVHGYEDWEFWFSLLEKEIKVYRIEKVHFFYRIRENSMARTTNLIEKKAAFDIIYRHHKDFIDEHIGNPLLLAHDHREILTLFNRIDSKIGRYLFAPIVSFLGKFFNA